MTFSVNLWNYLQIQLPGYIEQVRDKLAENIHEMWAMNKIEQGWTYSERRDDLRLHHPCLTSFEKLPPSEKRYDATLALQTLKWVGDCKLIVFCKMPLLVL